MPKSTLFAYAHGNDLDSLAEVLEKRFDALVEGRKWILDDVWVVNQHEPPHWDLGLNLTLPAAGKSRPKAWLDDVVAIASALAALHGETKRTFVIGVADAKGDTKDVFFVDSTTPDLAKLRSAFEGAVT
jgi:hypothetical protein